jgi:HEAT repeat protein
MMNAPGVPLTISLVMARQAGVKDRAIDLAIERSGKLLRFYIGKGAVPYGDHAPWTETHEDNGKCGMAGVLFNFLKEKDGAEFFSRMSVASHGPERDAGHTGNFFNLLWAMPGVALSGPQATGAWMHEFGAWYFDLARTWDGAFPHQGPPQKDNDSYHGWDATGSYLLAYAMPLKNLLLTGKQPGIAPQIDAATAQALLNDGRGWDNADRFSAYDKLDPDTLLGCLGSWSPVVRERAAMALARRKPLIPVDPLIFLLEGPDLHARYGACEALKRLGGHSAPAVDALAKQLDEKDLWLRVKAAEALAAIGEPAVKTLPKLLHILATNDAKADPRGMEQRFLSATIFGRGRQLLKALPQADQVALRKAIEAGLTNQDGWARGQISNVYETLTLDQIKPLFPAIHRAIIEPAPSGEMFAEDVRVAGLRILARHRVREGIEACVKYLTLQNQWASQDRTPQITAVLLTYGAHAKPFIPELREIADFFEKDEKDFPRHLMVQKANTVREAIRAIEAAQDKPDLIGIR